MQAEVRGELPTTPRIDVHTVRKHSKKLDPGGGSGPRADDDEGKR
jgi:hypothetical protein